MCLTLRNAVAVLDHQDGRSPAPGYTRARHHIGHLEPGDRWFPGTAALPHTVTGVHRRDGLIVLIDQFGNSYPHPGDAVVFTAVPDGRIFTPATAARPGEESAVGKGEGNPTDKPRLDVLPNGN